MSTTFAYSDEQWRQIFEDRFSAISGLLNAELGPELAPLATVTDSADPKLANAIDHTLLKPDATPEQIDCLCEEAIRFGFKSCCVNGIYAKRVTEKLQGSSSLTCCVIGFPLGAGSALAKAEEARQAIADGAREIDMVLPVGLLLSSLYSEVYNHLRYVIEACGSVPVKVIIETSLLPSPVLKFAASVLSAEAGAAFVKTSTGFNGGGATVEDVKLMRLATKDHGSSVKIKASGGVRTLEACKEMFKAGAERIGTSSGTIIMSATKQAPSDSVY